MHYDEYSDEYGSVFEEDVAVDEPKKTTKSGKSSPIIGVVLVASLTFIAIIYLNAQYPSLFSSVTGHSAFTSIQQPVAQQTASQSPALRLQQINALLISAQNKQDLRNGLPFWGSAPHMVELAFATTADSTTIRRKDGRMYEFHSFAFSGAREPVVMEFRNSELNCVHYVQRATSTCNVNAHSFYGSESFPYNYHIQIAN